MTHTQTAVQHKPMTLYWLLPILLPIALLMLVSAGVSWNWVQIPVHSVIEVVGAMALMVLVLLFATVAGEGRASGGVWFCAGLFCMGMADLLHALVEPGNLFVWFHSWAICLGGVLAALSWLNEADRQSTISLQTLVILTFALPLFGIVCVIFPAIVPAMLDEGSFTPIAWMLNISGGVGFLLAALWLWRQRATFEAGQLLIFLSLCLLNASAGLLFKYSQIWNFDWWLWHLLRLAASVVAAAYLAWLIRRIFIASGERDHLQRLLEQVHEQQTVLEAISAQKEAKVKLHEALLEANDLVQIGDVLLQKIADSCSVQVGLFYIASPDGGFTLSGRYAYPDAEGAPQVFAPGEGLISAVAIEKKPLFVADLAEDYMRVESGTLTRPLQQLCLYPFVHHGEVVAIAELGVTSPLSESALEFLSEIEATVTATILAARR